MKFLNKFFKFFKNIYLLIFSLFSIAVLVGVAVVGYFLKEKTLDPFINDMITSLGDEPAVKQIVDVLNTFLIKGPQIGTYLFWIPVILVSVFIALVLLSGITSAYVKSKKKKSGK